MPLRQQNLIQPWTHLYAHLSFAFGRQTHNETARSAVPWSTPSRSRTMPKPLSPTFNRSCLHLLLLVLLYPYLSPARATATKTSQAQAPHSQVTSPVSCRPDHYFDYILCHPSSSSSLLRSASTSAVGRAGAKGTELWVEEPKMVKFNAAMCREACYCVSGVEGDELYCEDVSEAGCAAEEVRGWCVGYGW